MGYKPISLSQFISINNVILLCLKITGSFEMAIIDLILQFYSITNVLPLFCSEEMENWSFHP